MHHHMLQESRRLLSTVQSLQPGAAHIAGATGSNSQLAQLVESILSSMPAPLSREDASVARDPFAPLSTGMPSKGNTHLMQCMCC